MASLDYMFIPKTICEVFSDPGCQQAMIDDMISLHLNATRDLVPLPDGKTTTDCLWLYTMKIGPDGKIDCLNIIV